MRGYSFGEWKSGYKCSYDATPETSDNCHVWMPFVQQDVDCDWGKKDGGP